MVKHELVEARLGDRHRQLLLSLLDRERLEMIQVLLIFLTICSVYLVLIHSQIIPAFDIEHDVVRFTFGLLVHRLQTLLLMACMLRHTQSLDALRLLVLRSIVLLDGPILHLIELFGRLYLRYVAKVDHISII